MNVWWPPLLCLLLAAPAWSAGYPDRPVRMIVAVPPGGPADILARLVGPRLSEALGQPDGYTFVLVAAGVVINPSLYREVRYDPLRDFAAITHGISVPNILVVHPSVPAGSLSELVALAKKQPGKIAFASAGNGTSGHLALELFKQRAGIDVTHVPYKGGGPALAEVLAGQVQALFSLALAATQQVKAGKVRALAITSGKRSAVAPELPTVAESGFAGYEVVGWFGWLAPAKTPKEIVARLNAEIVKALNLPEVRERLLSQSSEPVGDSPQAFAAFMKSEHAKWAGVIKRGNIRMD